MDEVTTNRSTLYAKMSCVMGNLERLPKNGFNQHFKYSFVTDADVVDAVRTAMSAEGLALFVSMDSVQQEGKRTTANFTITFADGESGATMSVHWTGEANDTQDKGIAKAATSAVKYALLKAFLISTGDDPDSDNDGPEEQEHKKKPVANRIPTAKKKPVPKKSAPKKPKPNNERGPMAVKVYLLSEAVKLKQRPLNSDDVSRIVPLLNGILGGEDARKAWLKWTYDIDSSKDLTGAQKDVLWEILKPTYDDKKWVPTGDKGLRLAEKMKVMYRESLKDAIKDNVQQMQGSPPEELGNM